MINKLISKIKDIDTNILNIAKKGIKYSSILTIISIIILFIYTYINSSNIDLFYIGFSLLKLSFTCIATFMGSTIVFDKIKKELPF